ncbi:MAG: 2-oxoglutarate dehydrogenase, E2 component, dihydrolipoamide succinyltransferase, partial [Actinobacteria bacterium]|nr:2-oxoglutarate dehydrogenase, E2 component, dihydrolipoamide succinyltransferase [Actinomycetota bacterium]
PAPAAAAPAPDAAAPAAPAPDSHAGYVTPLVRKLANERGIDLGAVSGTGVGGRIRKQDVLSASSATAAAASAPAAKTAAAAPVEVSPLRGTTVPMSRLRKVIAERAVISMQSSAQLTSVVEVDVTLVAHFRDQVKRDFQAKTGTKLSFLPFFALAAAEALQAYPIINATIEGDSIVYPAQENISIAVDTERGLLTPVIRDAASLDLAGFAKQIADLAERTRDNKLKPDELAGGTFTLTNTGSRGALFDTPIVFLPQSAILGTGIVSKKPVVVSDAGGDAIAIRSMVYLALSYDHRIVDGADAARFLVAVKNRLEGGDFSGKLGI